MGWDQWPWFDNGGRCRRWRHRPREPFRERQPFAAPYAQCQCGAWVLFHLDELSDELGPVMVRSQVVGPVSPGEAEEEMDEDAPFLTTGAEDVEAWARSAWEQRALLAALLYAQAWWIRRWMRLYDSAVLAVGLAGLTVTVSVMHSPAAAFAVAAFFGSIALTGLDNLLKESRRARRVSRALRRYGVDDTLIEEARRSFAPRRSE